MNDWKVAVPEYDAEGVIIKRFEITEREADFDKLRTALNPQRGDRSIDAGWFTRLTVDGTLWMTDTPAECRDLEPVDDLMAWNQGGTMLIVGLGLGVLLNRAIVHRGMPHIDVVEREGRVLDAVGPYYANLAEEHGVKLRLHHSDIHDWRPPQGSFWTIGFFDIWADIDSHDMVEVTRLRKRFRTRMDHFHAWAQDERIAQNKRIRTGTGWY